MNIKQYLLNTLENKEILNLLGDRKVFFLHATNPTPPYLEYEIINENGEFFCENKEEYTNYTIQVDIFSKKDYTEIEDRVKKCMQDRDFNRTNGADLYEKDTGLYHKAMRFNISLKSE